MAGFREFLVSVLCSTLAVMTCVLTWAMMFRLGGNLEMHLI